MMQDPFVLVSELPEENPHYLRAVTQMGDHSEVVADQDILTANGMKLIAKGSRIDSHQFNLLTKHKLSSPIDQCLSTPHLVDSNQLAIEVGKILGTDLFIARVAARAGDPLAIKQQFAEMSLPAPIQFRLTVMKDQRPELFEHGLRVSIWAHALAQQTQLPDEYRSNLMLAAICHDQGEMHTDPELLTSAHQIAPVQRRFIHVHPISSYLLVNKLANFPTMAAQAILHHHERLDGSGYPYGLRKGEIHPLSQFIAVADVCDAILRCFDVQRLLVSFSLNKTRFDLRLIRAVAELVKGLPFEHNLSCKTGNSLLQLHHIADLLEGWLALHTMLKMQIKAGAAQDSKIGFLFERMDGIRSLVLQMGFNPDDIHGIQTIAQDDPSLKVELQMMLNEMEWILNDMANEIDRRSPTLDGVPQAVFNDLVYQLRESVEAEKRS
jgi:HD-GYP domain-containing protein (c-di-GMP phosphodiesterase class II)